MVRNPYTEFLNSLMEWHIAQVTGEGQAMEYRDEKLMTALKQSIMDWENRRGNIIVTSRGSLEFGAGHECGFSKCSLCKHFGYVPPMGYFLRVSPNCKACPLPDCRIEGSTYKRLGNAMRNGDASKTLARINDLVNIMQDALAREAAKPEKNEEPNRVYEKDLVPGKIYRLQHRQSGQATPFIYSGRKCVGDDLGIDWFNGWVFERNAQLNLSYTIRGLRSYTDSGEYHPDYWVSCEEADQKHNLLNLGL